MKDTVGFNVPSCSKCESIRLGVKTPTSSEGGYSICLDCYHTWDVIAPTAIIKMQM